MKLYVDDLRACPEGWTLARTVTEAIRLLATQDFDEVSLDHDISHAISLRAMRSAGKNELCRPFPCGETFEPVAWFLADKWSAGKGYGPGPAITLHTANPIGAKKMAAILEDAGLSCTIELGTPVNGLE